MKPRERKHIGARLLEGQLLVATTVLVVCAGSFIAHDILTFKGHIFNNLDSTARVLSLNLMPTLSFMDQQEAGKILGSLKAEPKIVSATLYDKAAAVFASYGGGESETAVTFPGSSFAKLEGRRLKFYLKLYSEADGELMGILLLSSDSRLLLEHARNYLLIAFAVFLGSLGLAYLLAQYAQRQLSSPIVSLADVTKQISDSGDYSVRVGVKTQDQAPLEIFRLSQEFDRMLEQIQMKDEAITLANEQLEQKVVERTAELQASIQKQEETYSMLVQASKMSSLGEMAGGIAHEINNPLATLKILAEQIQGLLEEEPLDVPALTERAGVIINTVTRISTVITGMLSFSRTSEDIPMEDAFISDIISNTLVFCAEKLKKYEIALEVTDYPKDLRVHCRGNQVSQVLLNLLNNAKDAIASYTEAKWIRIEIREVGSDICLRVSNCGPKIPTEVAQKIFRPFFTTKPVGKGTGLGLSISQRILGDHKGSLSLDLDVPQTCFVMRLPNAVMELTRKIAA